MIHRLAERTRDSSAAATQFIRHYFFFLNDTATPEIYPLPLPDALPIPYTKRRAPPPRLRAGVGNALRTPARSRGDRKSTRLNSSHLPISYAVFCLQKKKKTLTAGLYRL